MAAGYGIGVAGVRDEVSGVAPVSYTHLARIATVTSALETRVGAENEIDCAMPKRRALPTADPIEALVIQYFQILGMVTPPFVSRRWLKLFALR